MIRRKFIAITISRESFDYDPLLNYLKDCINVYSLYIVAQGFLVDIVYENDEEYKRLMQLLDTLEVKDVSIHSIIDKTTLSDILTSRNRRFRDLYDGLDGT